jgi:opacity protein-like surface antigen
MISKKILALAALSLVAGSTAAAAQSAHPLSLANTAEAQRAGADMRGESDFLRRSGWVLGILAIGILVFVVLEANKDHALPDSP